MQAFPIAAQIAHRNESLRYLNEELVYLVSGTQDVYVSCHNFAVLLTSSEDRDLHRISLQECDED